MPPDWEASMGTGEFYYLVMVIGAATVFAAALAWVTWYTRND